MSFISKKVPQVRPYLGIGGGLLKTGDATDNDQLKGAVNIIAGSYINVYNGDLFVDYTTRNFFKYNQIIVGYRFPF